MRSSIFSIILRNWRHHLTHIIWTVFLMQYVIWFSEFWLSNTRLIVEATLWSVLLIEIILPLHWVIRRALQFIAIISIHVIVLDYQPVGGVVDSVTAFFNVLYENALLFHPFIWFGVAAWIIYLIVVSWVNTKGALYSAFISSVVLFAIIDSFSFYVLWNQVAIIILCGLVLVVIQHFNEFKQKHPASWEFLKDYPGNMISLIVIIISFTMVVGVMAPNVRPLMVDPYTAWKHMQGETVQTFGKGFDGFTPTVIRDSTSGYRRDDTSLGGGFRFDFSEVMKVNMNHRGYLRGETRSLYTGAGWQMSASEENAEIFNVDLGSQLEQNDPIDTSKLETFELVQNIRMISENVYPVLFGSYAIERLDHIAEEDVFLPLVNWQPETSVLHWQGGDEVFPSMYSVVSQVPVIDINGLREISTNSLETLDMEEYLQLPDGLPNRVIELAQNITDNETNVYDIVKEIESYLKMEFPYTNQPDLSKGTSDDFVDRFLFEIQEGYCDYYSTAMVVLVRSLGIPARWVKGYSSGVLAIFDDVSGGFIPDEFLDLDPNAGGEYSIRNADAHSWVEVYFEGYGWLSFEPTSGFSLPSVFPEDENAVTLPDFEAPIVQEQPGILEDLSPSLKFIIIALIILILIPIILYVRRLNLFSFFTQMRKDRAELPQNQKIVREFNRLLHYARKKGYTHEYHETVREMVSRWVQDDKWLVNDLESLMKIFERAKYSNFTITQPEFNNAMQICKKLREEMK